LKKLKKITFRSGFEDIQKHSESIAEYLLRYWVISVYKLARQLEEKGLLAKQRELSGADLTGPSSLHSLPHGSNPSLLSFPMT
jgi:hypothetical protein